MVALLIFAQVEVGDDIFGVVLVEGKGSVVGERCPFIFGYVFYLSFEADRKRGQFVWNPERIGAFAMIVELEVLDFLSRLDSMMVGGLNAESRSLDQFNA